MQKFYFLIVLVVSQLTVIAQNASSLARLLQKLQTAKEDSSKVQLYLKIANEYNLKEPVTANKYYVNAYELSKKIKYSGGIYSSYFKIVDNLNRAGKYKASQKIINEIIELAKNERNETALANAFLNAGILHSQMQDFEIAVNYLEQGKEIFARIGDENSEGKVSDILQFHWMNMHQYHKAIKYGKEAVAKLEHTKNYERLTDTYNNLGLNYIYIEKYDSAKFFLEKAEKLAQQTGDMAIHVNYNLNHAFINLRQGNFAPMKSYLDKALLLSKQNKFLEFEGLAFYGLAEYFLSKKETNTAKKYADSSRYIANRNKSRYLKQKLFPMLSNLALATNDAKGSIRYKVMHELLTDSVLNETVLRNTISMEKKYETQNKVSQIQLQQAQLKQKTTLNYLLIAGTVAWLLISLLAYRNYQNKQKLQQVKINNLEAEKHLTATEAVLKGEEQERSRLAKDLHDGLGGMLSGIKHSFYNMKGNLVMTSEQAQVFERSLDMLDSSISEMRRVAHNMMPVILVRYGLDAALNEYCSEINKSGVLHVNYQYLDMSQMPLDQTIAVTIYRIVQELVNNVIKHAAAKNLLVQLHISEAEKLLSLTVEDDGIGFDPEVLKNAKGIGWSNIKNRVDFLKGKIDLNSMHDTGTSVLIEIKL